MLGRDTSHIAGYNQLEAVRSLGKRAEPIEGAPSEGTGEEGGGSEGTLSGPRPNETGGSEGDNGQEDPNTESTGGEADPAPAPAPAPLPPAPGVVAPIPQGLGPDEMTLWNRLTQNPLPLGQTDQLILWTGSDAHNALEGFRDAMSARNPGIAFKDSTILDAISNWNEYFDAYD